MPQNIQQIEEKAKAGDADFQCQLAKRYITGNGVKQSNSDAFKWFELSAKQENSEAMNGLGYLYSEGKGVKENYEEAVKWFALAADKNNREAKRNLAYMYDGICQQSCRLKNFTQPLFDHNYY